jgi:hypothetical protein
MFPKKSSPAIPRLIAAPRALVDLLAQSTPLSLSPTDFYIFWSNLGSSVFLSGLVNEISKDLEENKPMSDLIDKFIRYLILVLRISDSTLPIERVFRGVANPYLPLAKLRVSGDLKGHFSQLLNLSDDALSFANLMGFVSLPGLFDDPLFCHSLFALSTLRPEAAVTILRFYLTFRTFLPQQDEVWVKRQVYALLGANPTAPNRDASLIAFAELRMPYGHAVLTLFEKLSTDGNGGVILAGGKLAAVLRVPVVTPIDKKRAITTLVALTGEPLEKQDDKKLSEAGLFARAFARLVDRARRSRVEEKMPIAPRGGASTNVDYVPLLWEFSTMQLPKKIEFKASGSMYGKVPLIHSGVCNGFRALRDKPNVTAQDIVNGRPLFFAVVIGSDERMLLALAGFIEFVISQPTELFSREVSFVLIPRGGKRARLFNYICALDPIYRATANQVTHFLSEIYPKISLKNTQITLGDFPRQEPHGNIWTEPVSPYHALQRLLTFYCDCATAVTPIPIWIATVHCAQGSFVFGFLSSLLVLMTGDGCLQMQCHLCGFPEDDLEPAADVWSVTLLAFALPFPGPSRERPVHTIVDPSLLLRLRSPASEFDDTLVDRLECTCSGGACTIELDGVGVPEVTEITVEPFRHPKTGERVNLPVRTFADLLL